MLNCFCFENRWVKIKCVTIVEDEYNGDYYGRRFYIFSESMTDQSWRAKNRRQIIRNFLGFIVVFMLFQLVVYKVGKVYLRKRGLGVKHDTTFVFADKNNLNRVLAMKREFYRQLKSIANELQWQHIPLTSSFLRMELHRLRRYTALDNVADLPKNDGLKDTKTCRYVFGGSHVDSDNFLQTWQTISCTMPDICSLVTFCFIMRIDDHHQYTIDGYHGLNFLNNIKPCAPIIIAEVGGKTARNLMNSRGNVTILRMPSNASEGLIWSTLLNRVRTSYVFIGRDFHAFGEYSNLQRPILLLEHNLNIDGITFALRNTNGLWDLNCYQMTLEASQFSTIPGYAQSFNESLLCAYSQGPILGRTHKMKAIGFDRQFRDGETVFLDFYLRLRSRGYVLVNTPDVMILTNIDTGNKYEKQSWHAIAKKWNLTKIDTSGKHHYFTCQDLNISCQTMYSSQGMNLFHDCCRSELEKLVDILTSFNRRHQTKCVTESVKFQEAKRKSRGLQLNLQSSVVCPRESLTIFNTTYKTELDHQSYRLDTTNNGNLIYCHKRYSEICASISFDGKNDALQRHHG